MVRVAPEKEDIKRARGEIEKKTGKTPEQLYEEREKRIMDAIALKEPDRVPVIIGGGYFPIRYAGLSPSDLFYRPALYRQAVIKTLLDFEPDASSWAQGNNCGPLLEILDPQQITWPGGNIPADYTNQFANLENMKADEYDIFLTDPTDFVLRYYLPRVFGALKPFSNLPTLGHRLVGSLSTSGFFAMIPRFTSPEFQKMAETLLHASQERAKFQDFSEDVIALGFPPANYSGGIGGGPPFDWIANHLRGMRYAMADMFERPEKLLAACEKILEWRLARAVPADPNQKWNPRRVGADAFHFTSDRFMSKNQFEKFVWPTHKKLLLASINLGFVPSIHMEGKTDDRVEYLLELPKGRLLPRFNEVDMARAKAILRDHTCIMGNVPGALMQIGSSQEVEEYCRNLINVCGKGGGFILWGSALDEAKPANIRVMVDCAKKYGQY